MSRFFLISTIFIFFACNSLLSANVNDLMENIPLEDRETLERLFHGLVNYEHFGYTIFENKPVSLGGYFQVTPWQNYIELGQCDGKFWNCWKTWEKYQHQFKFKNYLLLLENFSSNGSQIILINKKSFLKVLKDNLEIFETILGEKINPYEFLLNIENGTKTFNDSIKRNVTLLGIFLGYGTHNSIWFTLRGKILKEDCLQGFDFSETMVRIGPVRFAADLNHPETKRLKKKYEKYRWNVSSKYANGHFFEVSLSKLIEE